MFHSTIIVGRLGRDPEMRFTPSGEAVTNFNVAVSESYTNSGGERVEKTTWYTVSTFGKQAENCNQYLKKGKLVLVVGNLKADPKTGGPKVYQKQDGSYGASYELSGNTVKFLSPKNDQGEGSHADPEEAPF